MDEDFHQRPTAANPDQGEAFVRLLLEHEPQVRSFLRGLLPAWNDVDEVIQEASLVAWRKFADFQEGTAFGGWFLTIARFEALKHRRRIARTPLIFANDVWDLLADEAVDDQTQQIHRQHLEDCLGKLQPEKRAVLLQVHAPGVVMREVALQSGKSEQAFYKAIQRLRAVLLDCVSKSTPELDKLAKSGTVFTSAYVPHPFCGPSRMGLMTGRYPHSFGSPFNLPNSGLGIEQYNHQGIGENETLISTVLQNAGYFTGAIGKWHLGTKPLQHQPFGPTL